MVTNPLPPGLRVSGQRHHHLLYRSKDAQNDICSGRGRAHVSYDFGGNTWVKWVIARAVVTRIGWLLWISEH